MSLFEIELNKDFKILNSYIYLDKKDFMKLYKLNNLNDSNSDNIDEFFSEEYILTVENESILKRQDITVYYEIEEMLDVIGSDIYGFCGKSVEKKLYPEWLLFYIAIKKNYVKFIHQQTFESNLIFFKYISEMRYKEYMIRNIKNFISPFATEDIGEIQSILQGKYFEYIENLTLDVEALFKFLGFLYEFHYRLKENEKYKLMWNVETYIDATIHLLNKQGFSIDEIYKKVPSLERSVHFSLHDIYIYKPLYIMENKDYFQTYLIKINNVFEDNISIDNLMKILTTHAEYEDLLFLHVELIKRFNSNKRSEVVMGALVRSTVLDMEEVLRKRLDCYLPSLYDDCIKKLCSGSHLLNPYYNLIKPDMSNDDFFVKMKELCNEDDSLEKYLMIYYHSRNYLAHNNIEIHKIFEIEGGIRVIIFNIICSILIVLYRLEYEGEVKC